MASPEGRRLRTLTDDLMGELDKLVADLRARYPTRWTPRSMPVERDRGFSHRWASTARCCPPIAQETPSVPIFQTSTFRFDTSDGFAETINFRRPGYTYTRGYGNPTLLASERVMAELEGTESAMSFASGMAAIHTVATTLAASGDMIVASSELYGGTYSLFAHVLPRYGIDVRFVSPHDHDAVRAALAGSKLFYVETIANPNVTVADLEALGALASDAGVASVVDNTFASPYLCNPARSGSTTSCTRPPSTSAVTTT